MTTHTKLLRKGAPWVSARCSRPGLPRLREFLAHNGFLPLCPPHGTRLGASGSGLRLRLKKADQVASRAVAMMRVAKRKLAVDLVAVAASVASLGQVAGLLKVVDDLRRGSFSDPDADGDVSKARIRVGGDALEHMRVVGHEAP
jgi:hypothetical protein